MRDYARTYSRQEYLSPGAPAALDILVEAVRPGPETLLLDVAAGKGEAAAHLASHHGCRVVCVERYDPFIHIAAAKFWFGNLRDLASVIRADGGRLPFREAAFDAAACIGGPSLLGLDRTLPELARVLKPGGAAVVSDVVWRAKPETPLGKEWGWLAGLAPKLSLAEYAARLAAAGLVVERTYVHPRSDWEAYWRPMLEAAEAAKTTQPADVFFADEVESGVALERRAVEAYIDYATLLARKARQG